MKIKQKRPEGDGEAMMDFWDVLDHINQFGGIISLVITVITLFLTGTIKKAVKKKEKEVELKCSTERLKSLFLSDICSLKSDDITFETLRKFYTLLIQIDKNGFNLNGKERDELKSAIDYCQKAYTRTTDLTKGDKKIIAMHIDTIKKIFD